MADTPPHTPVPPCTEEEFFSDVLSRKRDRMIVRDVTPFVARPLNVHERSRVQLRGSHFVEHCLMVVLVVPVAQAPLGKGLPVLRVVCQQHRVSALEREPGGSVLPILFWDCGQEATAPVPL